MKKPCFVLLGALALSGCFSTTSEIKMLRTQQPANPPGCPVNVLDEATSPYPVEDLVVLDLTYAPGGREAAMGKLRDQTCYYGGDTVYSIQETPRSNASTLLSARIARKPQANLAPAGSRRWPLSCTQV